MDNINRMDMDYILDNVLSDILKRVSQTNSGLMIMVNEKGNEFAFIIWHNKAEKEEDRIICYMSENKILIKIAATRLVCQAEGLTNTEKTQILREISTM